MNSARLPAPCSALSIKYLIALLLPLALCATSCKTTQTATRSQLIVDSVGTRQALTAATNTASTIDRTITLDSLEMFIRQINFSPPDSEGRVVPTAITETTLRSGHRSTNNIESTQHDSTTVALNEQTDLNKKSTTKDKTRIRDETAILYAVIALFVIAVIILLIRKFFHK